MIFGDFSRWGIFHRALNYPYDELSAQGYTSLPKPDEVESGQMVLK